MFTFRTSEVFSYVLYNVRQHYPYYLRRRSIGPFQDIMVGSHNLYYRHSAINLLFCD